MFSVLRQLHAQQAIELVERAWRHPDTGAEIRLIGDPDIESHFAQSLGRIAASHHWDVERAAREFNLRGAFTAFPSEWTLEEFKVAALLRCADAAHIDHRRAPSTLFAMLGPKGLSRKHWTFQNKLAKPTKTGRNIVYTSGRDFGKSEAEEWWLCFDTCKMIANELQSSSAILREKGIGEFELRSVDGVERPRLFAQHVRCDGWEPVDAEVRVSDPVHLAQTLGGRNLYGLGFRAPLRELLQNAVDAARLRRSIGASDFQPQVKITLEEIDSELVLCVEDNGIGMSERVLTTSLLDFGKSGWRSQVVANDNPGITVAMPQVGGKFGIGFFSVFLLGDNVKVTTRRYLDGFDDAKVLEFVGLSRRPVIRKANYGELADGMSTRVEVKINDDLIKNRLMSSKKSRDNHRSDYSFRLESLNFLEYLNWLIVSADVDIEVIDKTKNLKIKHSSSWQTQSSDDFLDKIMGNIAETQKQKAIGKLSSFVDMIGDAGQPAGRAAIWFWGAGPGEASRGIRVGGLTYPYNGTEFELSRTRIPNYIGVINGTASIATRTYADLEVDPDDLANWATRQAEVGLNASISVFEQLRLGREVFWAGGDPGDLPFVYLGGSLRNYREFSRYVAEKKEVFVPINYSEGERERESRWMSLSGITLPHLYDHVPDHICISSVSDRAQVFHQIYDSGTGQSKVLTGLEKGELIDEEHLAYIDRRPINVVEMVFRDRQIDYKLHFSERIIIGDTQGSHEMSYGFLISGN